MLGLAINEQVPDPSVRLRAFRKKHGLTYPLLSDEKMTILEKFGFDGIPSNVVIDRSGRYAATPDSIEAMAKKIAELTR